MNNPRKKSYHPFSPSRSQGRAGCRLLTAFMLLSIIPPLSAQARKQKNILDEIDRLAVQKEAEIISWRRDIHEHPELGNREFRTAKKVAEHLRSLGIEVKTGVGHTGVVGLLIGGKPGPVVALRADMDALPVTEAVDVPFASKVRSTYNGKEVGVMHACGHDCHTAMLMGAVAILAELRETLPGTVKFIFQPAEEGSPEGERGGASLMIEEGVLEDPKPEVIFGQHIFTDWEVGQIGYKPEGTMASPSSLRITVRGSQTHGAYPWRGIDPIVVSSQIILGLQTITSRQLELTKAPAVITIATINGGVRSNIIPAEVTMGGTIRTFDADMQKDIHERIERTAVKIAESAGATAEVRISGGTAMTWNDPELTARMVPALERVTGKENLILSKPHTGAEDFSAYAQKIPGLFIFLGVRSKGTDPAGAVPLHSPHLFVDEGALIVGTRALASLAVEYMLGK